MAIKDIMNDEALAQRIRERALECGYDDCGIIPIADLNGYGERLQERLKKTTLSFLIYSKMKAFTRLEKEFPWAKSVIICTFWLGRYRFPKELNGRYAKHFFLSPEGVPDCQAHRDRLRFEEWLTEQGVRWLGGDKYAPVRTLPLRHAAVAAGLGVFRKNNFFYGLKGSYYELEGYLIDKECVYKQECSLKPCADSCTLCQQACKTKALSAPYTMNPMSCVSMWTTFGRGYVPFVFKKQQFGQWICGCDDCQDACPYNKKHDWSQGKEFPGLAEIVDLLKPENILRASDAELREKVAPRTIAHVLPHQVSTLRRAAKRALQNTKP
ncbi:MAG: 4Fe-4S double cluster binding domain-containing protein [bacterium]|nr:4Fe-4S double cluster binding domain-containing protein [bacterium]